MLGPDREANERITNAARFVLGVGEFAMRGRARMTGERFDAAETDGITANLKTSQKIECGGFPAVQFQRH